MMRFQRIGWHWLVLTTMLLHGGTFGNAQERTKDDDKGVTQAGFKPKEQLKKPEPKTTNPLSLEKIKLPSGTIVVVCPKIKDAVKLYPEAVVLSPTQYQALQNQIDQLKEQIANLKNGQKSTRAHPVVECRLSGEVQNGAALIQASFFVITYKDEMDVFLGGQSAVLLPNGSDLDGKSDPYYPSGNRQEGYTVHIPKAGEHRVTLHLRVPITERGEGTTTTKRTLRVGLPVASVTTLEVQFPKGLKEILVNNEPRKATEAQATRGTSGQRPVAGQQALSRVWKLAFAPTEELVLSWKEQPERSPGKSIVSGDWDIDVLVRRDEVESVANLTIEESHPTPKKWRLLLPKNFEIDSIEGPEDQTYSSRRDSKSPLVWIIDGPPTQKLVVVAKASHKRHPRDRRFLFGPFVVQGVKPQSGTIQIRALPEAKIGKYFYFRTNGNLRRRPPEKFPKEVPNVEAVFDSTDLGAAINSAAFRNPKLSLKVPPQLDLELKRAAALVETKVNHFLYLQKSPLGLWELRLRSEIQVFPKQNGLNSLILDLPQTLPAAFPLLSQLATINPMSFPTNVLAVGTVGMRPDWFVEYPTLTKYNCYEQIKDQEPLPSELYADPDVANAARVKLSQIHSEPFSVILEGTYQINPARGKRETGNGKRKQLAARVKLPQPFSISGTSSVSTKIIDDFELVDVQGLGKNTLVEKHKVVHQTSQAPTSIDLRWQKYQSPLPVTITADVFLRGTHPVVRESLTFDFQVQEKKTKGLSSRVVSLTLPPGIRGRPEVIRGGKELDSGNNRLLVKPEENGVVELEYDFPLTPPARVEKQENVGPKKFPVPLVWPKDTIPTHTLVRFWNDTGAVPTVSPQAQEQWKEEGPQIVANKSTLPVLVASSKQTTAPLTIGLDPSTLQPPVGVVVNRALMQVSFSETNDQLFRARFLVTELHSETLEVELPFPIIKPGPNQPKVFLLPNKGQRRELPYRLVNDRGRVIRIKIMRGELFQAPMVLEVCFKTPLDQGESFRLGRLLRPPRILGNVYLGQVKWQILQPTGQVTLVVGDHAPTAQTWTWEGWMFTPRSRTTNSELEYWICGNTDETVTRSRTIVFWTRDLNVVRLTFLPQQVWLLACSLLVLLVGGCLSLGTPKQFLWWVLVTASVIGVLTVVLTWPSLVPELLYGAQPGALILICVLVIQWFLHRRYRRRVLFLPSFTRGQKGSSIIPNVPQTREPSTIDAPVRRESSLEVGNLEQGTGSSRQG